MKQSDSGRLCLAYAAGPGDVVKTFEHWLKGEDDPHQVAVTYSGQFFDVCRRLNARGVVFSSCPRADRMETGQFHVENLPKGPGRHGIGFHLQQIRYMQRVVKKTVSHGAHLLVTADATGHFFSLPWFAPKKLGLVPSLHCTLWPKFKGVSLTQTMINRLNRLLFRQRAAAVLCLSKDIETQVNLITRNSPRPLVPFIPTYRPAVFEQIPAPPSGLPFNLLFAGRLETNKGIFDLLQVASDLKKAGHIHIHLHICGEGSKGEALRRAADLAGVNHIFHIHGYCPRQQMQDQIRQSHAFIVPTTTDFAEGFNKVVAEGILAGRPVITSSVCPAIDILADAVVKVPPDSPDGYRKAALGLAKDPLLYQAKRQACIRLQGEFYDPALSWGHALTRAIEGWRRER